VPVNSVESVFLALVSLRIRRRLLFAFRPVKANPSQGEGVSEEAENRSKDQGSDSKGQKESGLGGKTVPKA